MTKVSNIYATPPSRDDSHRRAFVTGGNGFLGSTLIRQLIDAGYEVHASANRNRNVLNSLLPPTHIHSFNGVTSAVSELIAHLQPNVIFHLAAQSSVPASFQEMQIMLNENVLLGIALLDGGTRCSVPPIFLNAGTYWQFADPEFSAPNSFYAASKQAFHDILLHFRRAYNFPSATLVIYDTIGQGDIRPKLWNKLTSAEAGSPIALSNGEQQIDIVHVNDVANAFLHAAELLFKDPQQLPAALYALRSGNSYTLREFIKIAEDRGILDLSLKWGDVPYPAGQIFKLWSGPQLPEWKPTIDIFQTLADMKRTPSDREGPDSLLENLGSSPDINRPLISIVVPVFNEESNVMAFHQAVCAVIGPLNDQYLFEFVFTDNHSTDRTFEILANLSNEDDRIRVFRFSRNFGYQRSIMTGYSHCKGAAAIQLDCDLQDPPQLIPTFIDHWRNGADVVYGVRVKRQESWSVNLMRAIFYRLIDRLSEDKIPVDAGDFRLISRRVIDLLDKLDDAQPYIRGTIATLGFRQVGVKYARNARLSGESKFPFSKLIALALDGILNHSTVPLRISTYFGFIVSSLTFFGIIVYAAIKLFSHAAWPAGFATLTALILASISINAMLLGIIGEYLGRMYRQMKKGPLTIIESRIDRASDPEAVP